MGAALGLASTSHLRDTGMPSRTGKPNPGSRDMAKDGVSGTKAVAIENKIDRFEAKGDFPLLVNASVLYYVLLL